MAKIRVALLGLGNVGSAVARAIASREGKEAVDITVAAAADRSGGVFFDDRFGLRDALAAKERGLPFASCDAEVIPNLESFVDALRGRADVVVESLPSDLASGEPALGLDCRALGAGMDLVTVDKGPVASGYDALVEAAGAGRSRLAWSGTTGVRVPPEAVAAGIAEVRGVLNGTTNYILNVMQERAASWQEALDEARRRGIAEPDPRLDLEGWDTAAKLVILARTAMGRPGRLDEVARVGIGPATEPLLAEARSSGRRVRLVGRARMWQGRLRLAVAPKLVMPDSPLYDLPGSSKGAHLRLADGRELFSRAASGRDAVARLALEDVIRLRNGG